MLYRLRHLLFIHSIGMRRMRRFLAVLRTLFHSFLLYTLSFHRFPPTSLPSSLTSPCHLFIGLPLMLVTSKLIYNTFLGEFYFLVCSSQWPRGLRRRSETAGLLTLWVRKPLEAWMCLCCECCVLSSRDLCDGLITRPLRCVIVCDQKTSRMRRPWPVLGRSATGKRNFSFICY